MASFSLQAQNCEYTFSGTLTDEHNGEPLVDAVINVIGSDVEVYSDFYGKFSINNLCEGRTIEPVHCLSLAKASRHP